jgi:NADPH:quinone reductase-like Zn-dependent oxidoreductase
VDEDVAVHAATSYGLSSAERAVERHLLERVLITGAGGGVGTFAVQIATAFGANVTASTRNIEVVRSIGTGRFFRPLRVVAAIA